MRISDWSSDVCSSDLLPIARHDWNGAANWRAQLDALLAQDRDQAFDIKKPPLMRLALVRLAPARHCIVWTRHHLTVDGWSLGIILDEVFTLYKALRAGQAHGLATAPAFRAYVDWEKSCDTDKARSHWQAELAAGSDQELAGHRPISLTQARAPDLRTTYVTLPPSGTAALNAL